MKSIISKIAIVAIVACITVNAQAGTIYQKMKSDTAKMKTGKMDKMKKNDKTGKIDKKAPKKMMKDTSKMGKM